MRSSGSKVMYYYNDIIIIMYNGKLQTVMKGSLSYFLGCK